MTEPPPHPDVRTLAQGLIVDAVTRHASDIHLEPTEAGYDVRFRIDGLLEIVQSLDTMLGRSVVLRFMVLSNLLTYRLDIPQEGRMSTDAAGRAIELRVAIMPTARGLRCAVRLPAELIQPRTLEALGLSPAVLAGLESFIGADSGMLVVAGPAGSGKTTTCYAVLERIAATAGGLSIITLEDPVERKIPGVTQIEVSAFGELTYERALRSILRQDPQVLMLGEIRDAATATLAVQAALSGHRLVCTLHAASPGGVVARLLEMGVEPYQVSASLFGILSQRLVRRLSSESPRRYRGRVPVGQFVQIDSPLRAAIGCGADADEIARLIAAQSGHADLHSATEGLIREGVTNREEMLRVIGKRNEPRTDAAER